MCSPLHLYLMNFVLPIHQQTQRNCRASYTPANTVQLPCFLNTIKHSTIVDTQAIARVTLAISVSLMNFRWAKSYSEMQFEIE